MNLGALLNSDVGTLRASAARGLNWWLRQIEEMVPRRLRQSRSAPRQFIIWDEGMLRVLRKDGGSRRMPAASARVALAVPARSAFIRTLQLPRMSAPDLRRLVELDSERLSPLPAHESVVGIETRNEHGAAATALVEVAVLPLPVAEQAIAAAREAGLRVAGFGLVGGQRAAPRFDFMPALRERGLLSAERSPKAIWWCVVVFIFILNVAVLVIRDQQSVARLSAIVEQQEPAVTAARSIQRRANAFDETARDLESQRRAHDVLLTLAIVSQDLPAGSWVQRFTYSARTARIVGYKRKDVDVIAALRRDARIASIRSNTAQLVAETPAGQPFDLTVMLRGSR